jgi:hypothetical protein
MVMLIFKTDLPSIHDPGSAEAPYPDGPSLLLPLSHVKK